MSRSRAAFFVLLLFAAGCARESAGPANATLSLRNQQTLAELVERGRAFAMIGDLTRGEQYLSAALEHGADARRVLPPLVHVCVEAGRYRVAADYVRSYMDADPDSTDLHLLYGLLEAAVGDRELARREYEGVIRSHPDDSAGHYALAVLLRDGLGDASGSEVHFREYLRIAPQGVHAAEARAALASEAP